MNDKADLEARIDHAVLEEFDDAVFESLVARTPAAAVTLSTRFESRGRIRRKIAVEQEMVVEVSLDVAALTTARRGAIYILASALSSAPRHYYSFDDLCAIFFPRPGGWSDWRAALVHDLDRLTLDLPGLVAAPIGLTIASEDPREQIPNFWQTSEDSGARRFYPAAYEVLRLAVAGRAHSIEIGDGPAGERPEQPTSPSSEYARLTVFPTRDLRIDVVQLPGQSGIELHLLASDVTRPYPNGHARLAETRRLVAVASPSREQAYRDFFPRCSAALEPLIRAQTVR